MKEENIQEYLKQISEKIQMSFFAVSHTNMLMCLPASCGGVLDKSGIKPALGLCAQVDFT